MKFAVKALEPTTSPWLDWVNPQYPNAFIAPTSNSSFLCKLSTYKWHNYNKFLLYSQTMGKNTYFWFDSWIHNTPLATLFPNLFPHSTKQLVKVATIMRDVLDSRLWNRLTFVVMPEMDSRLSLLWDFMPTTLHDQCYLNGGSSFTACAAYKLISDQQYDGMHARFIWIHKHHPRSRSSHRYFSDNASTAVSTCTRRALRPTLHVLDVLTTPRILSIFSCVASWLDEFNNTWASTFWLNWISYGIGRRSFPLTLTFGTSSYCSFYGSRTQGTQWFFMLKTLTL